MKKIPVSSVIFTLTHFMHDVILIQVLLNADNESEPDYENDEIDERVELINDVHDREIFGKIKFVKNFREL